MMIMNKQDITALVELCGRTAAINDCEFVGDDFQKVKYALKGIIEVMQDKIENYKEIFVAGYLRELSTRKNEQLQTVMAEAAFESLMQSMDNN